MEVSVLWCELFISVGGHVEVFEYSRGGIEL